MNRLRWRRLRCHFAAFFVAFGVLGTPIYMLVDRDPPFERFSGVVLPSTPHPGQMTQVQWDGHTKRRCDGYVRRWITDSEGVIWTIGETPVVGQDVQYGDKTVRTGREFRLPSKVALGPATYRSLVRSYCNFLQRWLDWPIIYTSPELPFTVTPGPDRH